MEEAVERVIKADRHPGRPHQRDRAAQDPDQGRRLALPVRADEAPADGLPGRGRGLSVATRRRRTTRPRHDRPAPRTPRRRRAARLRGRGSTPEVVRSILGIVLLVARRDHAHRAGPARRGRPDRLVARLDRAVVRDRALAAAVPAARGRLVHRAGPGKQAGLGLGDDARRARDRLRRGPRRLRDPRPERLGDERGGGRIGRFLAATLEPPAHRARARSWCSSRSVVVGLHARVQPAAARAARARSPARPAGSARPTADSLRRAPGGPSGDATPPAERHGGKADRRRQGAGRGPDRARLDDGAAGAAEHPRRAGRRGPSQSPMSQTVWTRPRRRRRRRRRRAARGPAGAPRTALAGDAPTRRSSRSNAIDWTPARRSTSSSRRQPGRVGAPRSTTSRTRGASRRSCSASRSRPRSWPSTPARS